MNDNNLEATGEPVSQEHHAFKKIGKSLHDFERTGLGQAIINSVILSSQSVEK